MRRNKTVLCALVCALVALAAVLAPSLARAEGVQGLVENSWRYENGEPVSSEEGDDGASLQVMDGVTLPAGATTQGIDVSEHNKGIDWDKAYSSGIDFVILRVSFSYPDEGGREDSTFEANARALEKRGIPYGVYVYSYASTPEYAGKEAEYALSLLKGRKVSLPVYYDMEDKAMIGADYAALAKAFCSKVESAGYSAGVYASLNWWNNFLTDPAFSQWDRWVAQWSDKNTFTKSQSLWQYTSGGTVPGIAGRVDMNYGYGMYFDKPDTSAARVSVSAGNPADVVLTASGFASYPRNLAFEVTSPSGGTLWYQADRQEDGSWVAHVDALADFAQSGTYRISAWTSWIGTSTFSAASASAVIDASATARVKASFDVAGVLSATASGWSATPSNVAFEVVAPSGDSLWYQADKSSDGSWTMRKDVVSDSGQAGTYKIRAWATVRGATTVAAESSASVGARFGSLDLSEASGTVTARLAVATGASSVSNVAIECNGLWFQAKRQSDGSWAASFARSAVGYAAVTVNAYAQTSGLPTNKVASASLAQAAQPTYGAVQATVSEGSVRVVLPVKENSGSVTNVAFECAGSWFQATRQSDGSWAAVVSRNGLAGSGTFSAYAQAAGGRAALVGSASFAFSDAKTSVALSSDQMSIDATMGQASDVSNVAVCVWPDSAGAGAARWYQARLANGSWSATVPVKDFGKTGTYTVQIWASNGSGGAWAVASSSVNVAGATAKLEVADSNPALGTTTLRVTDVEPSTQVTSVALEVFSPAGDDTWIQAYPQSDGTYLATVRVSDHALATGTYWANVWVARANGVTNKALGGGSFTVSARNSLQHLALGGGSHRLAVLDADASVTNVAFAMWSEKNGKDDLHWLQAYPNGSGSWAVDFAAGDYLSDSGTVKVDCYFNNGQWLGQIDFTVGDDEVRTLRTHNIQWAGQPNNYYCGPTTGYMILSNIGAWSSISGTPLTIRNVAAYMHTDAYGYTSFQDRWFERGMNSWLGDSIYTSVHTPSYETVRDAILSSFRTGHPTALDTMERRGGPHYNGHNNGTFAHIVAVNSYDQKTDGFELVDPGAGVLWGGGQKHYWYWSLKDFVANYLQYDAYNDGREHIGLYYAVK